MDRRGLNMLWKNECVSVEKQRGLQFIMCYFKGSSGSEKKVYFIIVFSFSVFYVLYMSIIVYSFDKLVFDNEALFLFLSPLRFFWKCPDPGLTLSLCFPRRT